MRIRDNANIKKFTDNIESAWSAFVKNRMDKYNELMAVGENETDLHAKLIKMELQGGDCPVCGRDWQLVQNNSIIFYKPTCQCFDYCPICKHSLWDYEVTNQNNPIHFPCCGIPRDRQRLIDLMFPKKEKRTK